MPAPPRLTPRTGRPEVNIDVPAVVGQFLNDLSKVDLIVELLQNELDAGSKHTVISFEEDALICEGDGAPIDRPGWERLKYVLGAGGDVLAKVDGIGAKNHGLRSAFLIGDTITVQSARHRIDLTAKGHESDPEKFFPAVWPKIRDDTAPPKGTRITVPYRTKTVVVTSGEGFPLAPPSTADLQQLFEEAVREAAIRFIAASAPGRPWRYELTFRKIGAPTVTLVFTCVPLAGRQRGLFRRTCYRSEPGQRAKPVEARCGAAFPIELAPADTGKVPKIFRRGAAVLGEINWRVDRTDKPLPATGALGYPIIYSTEHVRSGNGFNICGPFISGRARHSISDDARNGDIVLAARAAFADLAARQLTPLYGVAVSDLLGSERWPDAAAEDDLASRMLTTGAFPVAVGSGTVKAEFGVRPLARGAAPEGISIASPSYDPGRISSRLVQLAPEATNRLHPDTAPAAVVALMRASDAGDKRVTWFNEFRAAEAVLVDAPRTTSTGHATGWIDRAALSLAALETTSHHAPLPADLIQRLRKDGQLPTEQGEPRPWTSIRRSARAAPEVPGVTAPAILHHRLMKLSLLREGGLRVEPFRIDDYVSGRDFAPVAASGRHSFFNWLRKFHADLKPSTLSKIAVYPVWPGRDGSHHPLNYYCLPAAVWMRDLLAEVRTPPATSVTSFPGLRRRGNGAIFLRKVPSLEELQDWRRSRADALERLVAEGRQSEVEAQLARLEADLDRVRGATDEAIDDIAPDHRTLSRTGEMADISELHVASAAVQRVRLLNPDVAAGRFDELYELLGAATKPRAGALVRAMTCDPDQDSLFARLNAYRATGRPLSELSTEPIIMAGGELRCADELTFPSSIDWWGQWKRPLDKSPDIPERVALLEQLGVVHQALREDLSIAFFDWLATTGAASQRGHLQQVVRHWRERRYGPPRWIDRYPQLPCIPVRGRGDAFEVVSLQKATSIRSSIYLPDLPETQDRVLADNATARLAITAAKGVSDSVLDAMREAGVRSLRTEAGRPISIRTSKSVVTDSALTATLAHIQSRAMLRGLTQRLPHFEVPLSALRHDWRQHLSALKGVRIARELEAVFSILRREYTAPVDGGVDRATSLICIDARVDPKLAFYETLAAHIFVESASGLWAYGLLRAIESRYEPTLFDYRAEFPDDDEPEEPGSPPPSSDPPKAGHGLAPGRLSPAVPNPMPLADISNPTTLSGKKTARHVGSRPKASTDDARNTIEEEDQKLQLKEAHYGWHCQACLGEYEVLKAAPPGSYVYLPSFRQRLIEAHHVTHLQNQGVIGGKNLIVVCKFHHDYMGDRLSGDAVRAALRVARPTVRRFPSNPEATHTVKREGVLAEIEIDAEPWRVRLYFTQEHAEVWLS